MEYKLSQIRLIWNIWSFVEVDVIESCSLTKKGTTENMPKTKDKIKRVCIMDIFLSGQTVYSSWTCSLKKPDESRVNKSAKWVKQGAGPNENSVWSMNHLIGLAP